MKVLFITEYFPATPQMDVHGGVEMRTFQIAKYLSKHHEVEVISSYESDKPQNQLFDRVRVKRVGLKRIYAASTGSVFYRLVFVLSAFWRGLNSDFDIVEGSGLLGWVPAYILSVIKIKKRILFFPDYVKTDDGEKISRLGTILLNLQKIIINAKWHHIICISHTVREKLIINGTKTYNVSVVYCSADIGMINKIQAKKKVHPTIICVARLVSYKRVSDLILAMALISKKFPFARLEIIGLGDQLVFLKKLVSKLQLNSKVKFHGFVKAHKDVLTHIKSSYIFCLPSLQEGFGIVTIEALIAGVPLILPNLPIYHEVTRNKGVLFFEPKNYQELATCLEKLLESKKIHNRLVIEGKKVASYYSLKKMERETEKVYERVHAH